MPKSAGKHKYNRLTDLKVRRLSDKGRYGDGGGLYLVVTASGSKQWVLRTMVNGRRKDIGLGGYPTVSLAHARNDAADMRLKAKQGIDPVAARREAKKTIPTFEEAARQVHAENIPTWKATKAVDQWINSLENYAFPKIGKMTLNDIRPSDIISVLSPIWVEKHSTANRVRQRMSRVFDWAKTQEFITHANPVAGIKQGLPKATARVKHFAAMPYDEVSAFLSHLHKSTQSDNVKLGLEFLILTACRSGELRYAKWEEVDFEGHRWIVPAERMKAGKEHVVPLTERSMAILQRASELSGGGSAYLFPSSQNWNKTMCDATLTKALKKGLGYPFTVHGFRSSFRDWASETTSYPNDVVEMALAHTNPNKTEAAYKRGDLFEKRKALMDEWGAYCSA
jgi:integrase